MRPFAYVAPPDLEAALAELQADTAQLCAGGTDLVPLLKDDRATPGTVVHLLAARLPELARIEESPRGGLVMGALVTLADLTRDDRITGRYPSLAAAAASAATPQLRNAGTIGGNLRQRSRCEYYRHGLPCLLLGGDKCGARAGDHSHHAIFSESDCISAWPSDPATALLALGARVRLTGPAGPRELPLDDFYMLPGAPRYAFDVLAVDEIVTSIELPPPPARQSYRKAMDRATWAFALASLACAWEPDIATIRLASAGVAPIPWRLTAVEAALQGSSLDAAARERALAALRQSTRPLPGNTYKVDLLASLLAETLSEMAT